MASWLEFSRQAPDIAALGEARFRSGVAYLGTLRADGGPRVHPVTPIIGEQLFLFMEPTSPKGKDLRRDGRYTLHCSVADADGGEGEFYVRGQAIWTLEDISIIKERVSSRGGRTLSVPCSSAPSNLNLRKGEIATIVDNTIQPQNARSS
jgi:hypothetical protein